MVKRQGSLKRLYREGRHFSQTRHEPGQAVVEIQTTNESSSLANGTGEPSIAGKLQAAKTKNLTGPKIRLFRKERGWTQDELAMLLRKMGTSITRDIIANIETQRCPVTDCQVALFAKAFGVSLESLFLETTLSQPTNTPGKTHNPKNRSTPNAKGVFPRNAFARMSRKIGKFAKWFVPSL